MQTDLAFQPVRVLHRTGQWCDGFRFGEVLAYDVTVLPEYRLPGGGSVDRCYLLPKEGVQLTQPVTFGGALAGGWYIDLIEIEDGRDGFVVRDLYIDILISASRPSVRDLRPRRVRASGRRWSYRRHNRQHGLAEHSEVYRPPPS